MKNVLITGGAGYLGSILSNELLNLNYNVSIIDKFKWGINPILPLFSRNTFNVIKADVRDEGIVKKVLKEKDIIINLAAIVGYPACDADPWEATTTNVQALKLITDNISEAQLLIQASTGSSYGKVKEICTENTPINPLTLYGKTKAEAEKLALSVNGISLRFATVYGISPRMRLDLFINDLVYSAINKGVYVMYEANACRTFLHAKDAVSAIIFAINKNEIMKGHVFNVGDDKQNYTKIEVANLLLTKIKYLLHVAEIGKDKDERDYQVSYDKINALGFNASISLEKGLEELIKLSKVFSENSIYKNFN